MGGVEGNSETDRIMDEINRSLSVSTTTAAIVFGSYSQMPALLTEFRPMVRTPARDLGPFTMTAVAQEDKPEAVS